MQSELLHQVADKRSYALVLEIGDETIETLTRFATENNLSGAHFTAIGAFQDATLAYWDWDSKQYQEHPVHEQVECASLIGNVALAPDGEKRKVHAHCVLGLPDGSARAGHLRRGVVRPTLEVFLTEGPAALHRQKDRETGLALIRM